MLSPATVLIEDGKVKKVGSPAQVQRDAPIGVKIIDLGNVTLLPGLIDGHTHLLLDVVVPPEEESKRHENGIFAPPLLLAIAESPVKRAFLGARMRVNTWRAVSRPSAISVIPESTAIPNCVTPSMRAAFPVRESWPRHANSSHAANTCRTSILPSPSRSYSRSSC